ncbi:hypothetical protein PPYR_04684 [Photinus pyralis]|uniref:Protein prenyltransferase alpha subunit repeat-containing protein 1 n=1 Tax=Photinus pyralis TaxID=7054 RepID=A0A1Y1M0E6_PHOPY|nr:protein prenyltransferase alpha subunit repeat-containing protein 1 [Photinus pyralis]KAB0802498.1 hypothetical protein PPYR_04684 [Photinus pyralis]
MEEDNAMYEKILIDIKNLIRSDPNLKDFCIVPINENKNKSPVLYEEHNLGLELWCVKYVYAYLYKQLFKLRRLLSKNRLIQQKSEEIDKYLISALLIHPEVATFWNMRRELVEYGVINLDIELLLTKLVLSNKSKSNEAFAYRKWIVSKLMKGIYKHDVVSTLALLNQEFTVTEMAAQNSPNNYHAWNHRMWCLQSAFVKHDFADTPMYLNLVFEQLDFSIRWIQSHISEHAGFHYRQYLLKCVLNSCCSVSERTGKIRCLLETFAHIKACDDEGFVQQLLGRSSTCVNRSMVNFILLLLEDLFYFMDQLNELFPGHEAVWYHRRFLIFHILQIAHEYHNVVWFRNVNVSGLMLNSNDNIINVDSGLSDTKYPKLPKYELDAVESSYLYKILLKFEFEHIQGNSLSKCIDAQRELARRHEKWLHFILCFNKSNSFI